jgi:glycosyltransferase involved in cell wall biosynthesis
MVPPPYAPPLVMSTIHASVGILTFNSEKTIGRALESVQEFDDIVICDGGSTDATREIAHSYGARIIEQSAAFKNPNGSLNDFGGVRQQCLTAAKHDWFLYIDSDETISDGLREEIRTIVSKPRSPEDPLVYRVPIGILLSDRPLRHSSSFPGYQHRFFSRKSGAYFIKPVHERITFDASVIVGTLTYPWYIHTEKEDWTRYLADTAGYRQREAVLYAAQPWGFIIRNIIVRGFRTMLGVTGKSLYNYVRYGFYDSVPVRGEIGRALAPLFLMGDVLHKKLLP